MGACKQVGLILLLASVAAVGSALFHPSRPAWYAVRSAAELRWKISPEEARRLSASGEIVWIDARSRARYEEEHLPGAILLNAEDWSELIYKNLDTLQGGLDRPVIVYCDGENCARSHEVAERLRELLGLDPVYVLDGEWRELQSSPR